MTRNVPQDEFARRRAARQKRIRKRRIFISFIFFIIVALIVGVGLSLTVFFPVREISASGSEIYTPKEIAGACGLSEQDNLFTFSADTLISTLRKELPYIETVKIKRELPGTVKISVTDAREQACYLVDGLYYIVSDSGFVLNSSAQAPENVFEVIVKNVKCKVGSYISYEDSSTGELIVLLIDFLENKDIKIDYIDMTDILAIHAGVEGRFEVNFGTGNYLERKVAHLAGMVAGISPEKSGKINLSMWAPDKTEGTFVDQTAG